MCIKSNGGDPQAPVKYKFSGMELITNTISGTTSPSALAGLVLIAIPLLLVLVLTIWYFFHTGDATNIFELMDKFTTLITLGSGLLGLRKVTNAFSNKAKISIGGGPDKDDDDDDMMRGKRRRFGASSGDDTIDEGG